MEETPGESVKPAVARDMPADNVHVMMRRLYLEQGWGTYRIANYLRVKREEVRRYLDRSGLTQKKKDGTWTPEDLLMPEEAVHRVLEKAEKRERNQLKAATQKGAELAARVVEAKLSREEMARETLRKLSGMADKLAERMDAALDDMMAQQRDGKATMDKEGNVVMVPGTNMRDFKDMTSSFLNAVRGIRELAGEDNKGSKAGNGQGSPVRIGVIGNVRISGGALERAPEGSGEPVAIEV